MARLSGLQREVLGLYRQCLRGSRTKPEVIDYAQGDGVALTKFGTGHPEAL